MKKQTVQLDVFKNRVAEVSLVYHSVVRPADRVHITQGYEVYDLVKPFFDSCMEHRERVVMVMLNRGKRVLGVIQISEGGTTGTVVDAKIIFQAALTANAEALILVHNHPSGNTQPSRADIEITKKLRAGGKLLDIEVLDHLVVTSNGYTSLANEGLL